MTSTFRVVPFQGLASFSLQSSYVLLRYISLYFHPQNNYPCSHANLQIPSLGPIMLRFAHTLANHNFQVFVLPNVSQSLKNRHYLVSTCWENNPSLGISLKALLLHTGSFKLVLLPRVITPLVRQLLLQQQLNNLGKHLETNFPSLDLVGRAVSIHLPLHIDAGGSIVNSLLDQKPGY